MGVGFKREVDGARCQTSTRMSPSAAAASIAWRQGLRYLRRAPWRPAGAKSATIHGMNLGLPELLVILAIIILVFGANRLPDLGRGIGRAIRNFKEATNDGRDKRD